MRCSSSPTSTRPTLCKCIATQERATFDVATGQEINDPEARLDPIEPLPLDVHNVLPSG